MSHGGVALGDQAVFVDLDWSHLGVDADVTPARIEDGASGYGLDEGSGVVDREAAVSTEGLSAVVFDFEESGSFDRDFAYLRSSMWKKPLIVAPYDAELFGHHWYEGPRFLYYLFKKLHYDQNRTELITPSGYLAANPTLQDIYCNVSSWGHEGTFVKWMCGDTSWMYRHGHEAAKRLGRLVREGIDTELQRRVLAQAARQLMVATSSDLPFVISNGHFVDRMKEQFCGNLRHFYDLCEDFTRLKQGTEIDHKKLRALELENNLFPNLDPHWFVAL